MGAVNLNVHHCGAFHQVNVGNTDQTADYRLAKLLFILAVVSNGIACDGAVLDGTAAKIGRIIISDAHQTAQSIGALILVFIPCTCVLRRVVCAALDHTIVVAVEHDVFDRCACRGAEYAYIIAVGLDGDVLDVVVPAIVLPAKPRIQHNIVVAACMIVYRAGNGIEHSILCAVRRIAQVCTVDIVGLAPTVCWTRSALRLHCPYVFIHPFPTFPHLLRCLCCGVILQIGKGFISRFRDLAVEAARVVEIAPVDELQLIHGADLVLLGRILLAEVLLIAIHILDRAVGVSEEGADGVDIILPALRQRPFTVGIIGGFQPQTLLVGPIAGEGISSHLLGKRFFRCVIFPLKDKVVARRQLPTCFVLAVVAVAVGGDLAAVIVGGAKAAALLAGSSGEADVGEVIAAVGAALLLFPIDHADGSHVRVGDPVAVVDGLLVRGGDAAGIGIHRFRGVRILVVDAVLWIINLGKAVQFRSQIFHLPMIPWLRTG